MLVVKFCVELLRSCGINNLVPVPTTLCSQCLDCKLLATSNNELVTYMINTAEGEYSRLTVRECLVTKER